MTKTTRIAVIVVAAALVAQPCAASDFREAQGLQGQSSVFAGLSLRLPLGQAQKARPTARLQLTTFHTLRDERTGATRRFRPRGLEIGGTKEGKAALTLNGQSAADIQNWHNHGGTGTTLPIAGGVVLLLAVVVAPAAAPGPGECPVIDGNRDHCID